MMFNFETNIFNEKPTCLTNIIQRIKLLTLKDKEKKINEI